MRRVLERAPDVLVSVSATTRPPRPGERDGIDYHFVQPEDFERARTRGDLLEWAEVYGNLYGTPRAPLDEALAAGRAVLCELDIQGAMEVKEARPDAVLVFIEPPSLEDLAGRLRGRGTEDPGSQSRRVAAAYDEIKAKSDYDHIIVNDRIEDAVESLVRILQG